MSWETCRWCGCTYERIYSNIDERLEFCSEKCYLEYKDAHSGRNRSAEAASAARAEAEKERRRTLAEIDARFAAERRERERERKRDPKNWFGSEWADHLVSHPEDAFQCDWSKLRGDDIIRVLYAQPEVVPATLDWPPRLNGADWAWLLGRSSKYADLCDWDKLGSVDWVELLSRNPKFGDRCPWGKLNGENWGKLLAASPQFSEHCSWDKLSTRDNRIVLQSHPELVDKCILKNISGDSWSLLLQVQPQLSEYCDKWSDMSRECLMDLFAKRPEFLIKRLDVAEKYDLSKLTSEVLFPLLIERPELAKKCGLSKLTSDHLLALLMKRPELAKKRDLARLKDGQWNELIGVHKEFASRYDRWTDDVGQDLKRISKGCPNLAIAFDWNRLGASLQRIDNHAIGRVINEMSVATWVKMVNSNWYAAHHQDRGADCLCRDWRKYPGDIATADEGDVVGFLCTEEGVKHWEMAFRANFLKESRIELLKGVKLGGMKESWLLQVNVEDFTFEDWTRVGRFDCICKDFPSVAQRLSNEFWLAHAHYYCGAHSSANDVCACLSKSGVAMAATPFVWGHLYGAIDERHDEAKSILAILDKFFDHSQYGANEWADFLIAFSSRRISDAASGSAFSGKIVERFLSLAAKFDMSNLSEEKKLLMDLDRISLLERFGVRRPQGIGRIPSVLTTSQLFFLVARFPAFSKRVDVTSLLDRNGNYSDDLCLDDFVAVTDVEWENVLKLFPTWDKYTHERRDRKCGKKRAKSTFGSREVGCIGCLWILAKLTFWIALIGVGLCVGASFIGSTKVPEIVQPAVVRMSEVGEKIISTTKNAYSQVAQAVERKCTGAQTGGEKGFASCVMEMSTNQVVQGVGALVVLVLLWLFRKKFTSLSGFAEGGVIPLLGRVGVLGWCLYKTGIAAIVRHNFATAAIMLVVALWIVVKVGKEMSRKGWWRWLLLAGCFGVGLADMQSAALAGAVALLLGPAKLKG